MVCATPCVVPVAEKYTTSVLPVVVTVLVASEEAAALEAATDDAAEEATEELLTLLAELPGGSGCAGSLQKLAAGNFILHTKHTSIYVKCRESQRTSHASVRLSSH